MYSSPSSTICGAAPQWPVSGSEGEMAPTIQPASRPAWRSTCAISAEQVDLPKEPAIEREPQAFHRGRHRRKDVLVGAGHLMAGLAHYQRRGAHAGAGEAREV